MTGRHDFHAGSSRVVSRAWWRRHVGAPFRSGDVGLVLAECSGCGERVTAAGNPLAVVGFTESGGPADDYFTPTTMPVVLLGWPTEWDGCPVMIDARSLVTS